MARRSLLLRFPDLWEYWRVRDLFVGLQAFTWFTYLQMDGTWVAPGHEARKGQR
jgi:hypothetical protein